MASKALTELITNASDAVIMKAANLEGINPSSPDCPQSPQEAVRLLFRNQLPGSERAGRLNDIDSDADLREFARNNLVVGITGERDFGETCFTFVDNGEGQKPEDFNRTFLSFSHNNKASIPYTQGKYNMGSSGVLNYCGQKRYKLIVSRHHSETTPWGWTLVREKPGNSGQPVYEYFAPSKVIQTLDCQNPIFPLRTKEGNVETEVSRNTGTIVKIFDYKIDGRNDFIGVRHGIDQNMISTTLPVRLMDYRYPRKNRTGRSKFVDERTALGLEAELTRKKTPGSQDNDGFNPSEKITIHTEYHPTIGTVVVEAVLLDSLPDCLKQRCNDRVFHHVNGQVQYKQKRGYLSQTIGLPGLMDHVTVIVDASNLHENAQYKIWSPNRENIINTTEADIYNGIVESALRNSADLREWEQLKAVEKINRAASKAQNNTFQNLLNRVPEVKSLLGIGEVLTLPRVPSGNPKEPYQGVFTPTYLTLNPSSKKNQPIQLEIGERREISFKTDANNDYLIRAQSPGKAFVTQLQAQNLPVRISYHLRDGTFLAGVQTIGNDVNAGDRIELEARFLDPNLLGGLLFDTVDIELTQQRQKQKRERKPKPTPQPQIALPESRWLTKDAREVGEEKEPTEKWPEGFTDHDGGVIRALTADTSLYCINFDNVTLQNSIRRLKEADRKQIVTMHRVGMQLSMLAMQKQFKEFCETKNGEDLELLREYEEDIYRLNAQAIAMVMPLLMKTLPDYFRLETAEEE